jgi:hypothetical protein
MGVNFVPIQWRSANIYPTACWVGSKWEVPIFFICSFDATEAFSQNLSSISPFTHHIRALLKPTDMFHVLPIPPISIPEVTGRHRQKNRDRQQDAIAAASAATTISSCTANAEGSHSAPV